MTTNNTKRLLRTPDGIIAGVCGGLAEFFGLDVSLIRIATLILILRPFDLGLHHPLADRAEGSEAINRIAQWPKTT